MQKRQLQFSIASLCLFLVLVACGRPNQTEVPPTTQATSTEEPGTIEPTMEVPTAVRTQESTEPGSIEVTIGEDNLEDVILEVNFGVGGGGGGSPPPNGCYEEDLETPITQEFDVPSWAGWATTWGSQDSEVGLPMWIGATKRLEIGGAWQHCGCGFEPDTPVELNVELPTGDAVLVTSDNPMHEQDGLKFALTDVQQSEPEIVRDTCYDVTISYSQVLPPVGDYHIRLSQGEAILDHQWAVTLPDSPGLFDTAGGVQLVGYSPNEEITLTYLVTEVDAVAESGVDTTTDINIPEYSLKVAATTTAFADQLGALFVRIDTTEFEGSILIATSEHSDPRYECFGPAMAYGTCFLEGNLLAILSGEPQPTSETGADADYDIDTSNCILDFSFIRDITIPDNTQVTRGETFEKIWLIRNVGTCFWGPEYQIVQIDADGNHLMSEPVYFDRIVAPGEEVEIALVFTVSDDSPIGGTLIGTMGIQAPNGEVFGRKPYVRVVVAQ